MKGYTVFNVEQIEGLPEIYYAKAQAMLNSFARRSDISQPTTPH